MTLPATITPLEGVFYHGIDAETIVLNSATERFYGIGGVGGRMWELFSAGNTSEQVIAILLDEYDVERDAVERDLQNFVDTLVAAKLVETAG